jgi:hypothetical protein
MVALVIYDVCSYATTYMNMKAEIEVLEYVQASNKKRIEDMEEIVESLKRESERLLDELNTLKSIKMDELIEKVMTLDKAT